MFRQGGKAPAPQSAGEAGSADAPVRPLPEPAPTVRRDGGGWERPAGPSGAAGPSIQLTPPAGASEDAVRVALLVPLSGPNAGVGRSLLNAAQLALFDFGDARFELVVHDTRGTAEGAAEAAAVAVGDGARLMVGPLLSASVQAVAPTARDAGVNVIAFSNDPAAARENVFLLGLQPGQEVERVVAYAVAQGIARFAVLAPSNPYGRTVVEALRDAAGARGANLVETAFYPPHTTEFSDVVRRLADYDRRRQALLDQRAQLASRDSEVAREALKRLERLETVGDVPYRALLVAEGGKQLQAIAALLPFYDIDPRKVRMLGTGLWDVSGLGAEPALVGGWYAAPPPEARGRFDGRYREAYGRPPHRLATLAYDAVALAAVLARAEGGPDYSAAALTDPAGFAGRDGIFRFTPDGLNERGFAVLRVGPKENTVIAPAPTAFKDVVN